MRENKQSTAVSMDFLSHQPKEDKMATTFLTIVIGWYLLVMGLLIVLRQAQVQAILTEITAQKGQFFIAAVVTFIIGLLMVVSHNIWTGGWPLVITIFSWLVLISGIVRLFFPDVAPRIGQSFFSNPKKMQITGIVLIIIGLYFLAYIYFFNTAGPF